MKLRARHLVVLVGLALAAFMVYAIVTEMRGDKPPAGAAAVDPDEAFLKSVRREADSVPVTADSEVGAQPPAGSTGTPKIELETEKYDIGTVANNKPGKGQLMIYNRGDFDLQITNVTTSCGCTIGSVKNKLIPAGGKEPLEVVVFPEKIPGFEATRVLTVYSNDTKRPEIPVYVTTHVDPEFIVDPDEIDFGNVTKGEILTKQVHIQQRQNPLIPGKDETLKIDKAQVFGAKTGFQAELKPIPADQWKDPSLPEYTVDVSLDTSKIQPGPLKARYTLNTNVPRLPVFGSEVMATVTAPYVVNPPTIALGRVAAGSDRVGKLSVQASEPLEITDVVLSGNELQAEVLPMETVEGPLATPAAAPAAEGATAAPAAAAPAEGAAATPAANAAPAGPVYKTGIAVRVAANATPNLKREEMTFNVKMGGKTYSESVRVTALVVKSVEQAVGTAAAAPATPAPTEAVAAVPPAAPSDANAPAQQ